MGQNSSSRLDLGTDFEHRVVPFPTRRSRAVPAKPPEPPSGRAGRSWPLRLRKRAIQDVVVLEVTGRLGDAVEELDRAVQLALADGPRGVVCDLSTVFAGAGPSTAGAESRAVEMLAASGRHGRDWPGVPVAVACADPQVRRALHAHPLGVHLIVRESLFSAVSEVLGTPTLAVERFSLTPHPTARRASREFVTRTLLDWGLDPAIPFSCMVVAELVAKSSVSAGTRIDLSIAHNLGALRLAVRDHSPSPTGQPPSFLDVHVRQGADVAGLFRTFGVLPAYDGGKVIWAVLDASLPHSSTRHIWAEHVTTTRDVHRQVDACEPGGNENIVRSARRVSPMSRNAMRPMH